MNENVVKEIRNPDFQIQAHCFKVVRIIVFSRLSQYNELVTDQIIMMLYYVSTNEHILYI